MAVPRSPSNVVTFVKAFTNKRKAPTNTTPFSISSGCNIPISFTTPTMSVIAAAMDNNNRPTFAVFSPLSIVVTFTKIPTNMVKPETNAAAFPISPQDILATNFATATIANIAIDIFSIILPALSISFVCFLDNFETNPNAVNTAAIAMTNPANPRNPCFASSGFMEPISFTVAASINKLAPIATNPDFRPLSLTPFLSKLADAESSLFIAKAKPNKIPDRTIITATALNNLSWST